MAPFSHLESSKDFFYLVLVGIFEWQLCGPAMAALLDSLSPTLLTAMPSEDNNAALAM